MSRADLVKKQTGAGVSTPVKVFPSWGSEEKAFKHWRKDESLPEKGEDIIWPMPFKFALVGPLFASVGGWSKLYKRGFYSNEILMTDLKTQPLRVRNSKSDANFEKDGTWDDLKGEAEVHGYKFNQNIYAMTEDGQLVRLSMKGATLYDFGEFLSTVTDEQRLENWIEIKEFDNRKNGSNEYTVPIFELGGKISKKDGVAADAHADVVEKYIADMADAKAAFADNEAPSTAAPAESVLSNEVKDDTLPVATDDDVDELEAQLLALKAAREAKKAA